MQKDNIFQRLRKNTNILLSWRTPTFTSEDAVGVIRELNEMFGHQIPQSSGVLATRTVQLHTATKEHQITHKTLFQIV